MKEGTNTMADFSELLRRRRSIRDFENKDIPLELIEEIIGDSCLAPSSGNGQPWRFIIIQDRRWMKRLSDESKKNFLADVEGNPEAPVKKYETALRKDSFNVFYNAPCLIYIVGAEDIPSVHVDCTLAACYLMFSAVARGLGTCWIGLGSNIRAPEILRAIGMPRDCKIVAPIIVGYPKSIPAPPDRNEPRILKVLC
jgi:nitroreductase